MKKIIKLTERDLVRIVKRVINEQMDSPTGLNVVMNPDVKKLMNKNLKDKWGRPSMKNGKPTLWYGFNATTGKWEDGGCKGLSGKTDQNKCRTKLGLPSKSAPTKPGVEDDGYGRDVTTVVPSSDGGMSIY